MLLFIWTRDDATGLLDDEFKDGDVLDVREDADEASLGNQEKRSFLVIKVDDPPNKEVVAADLVRPEYAPGATPAAPNVVRHKRIHNLDWRQSFTADEIAKIVSAGDLLPDGPTSQNGMVAAGVVSGLFTVRSLTRK